MRAAIQASGESVARLACAPEPHRSNQTVCNPGVPLESRASREQLLQIRRLHSRRQLPSFNIRQSFANQVDCASQHECVKRWRSKRKWLRGRIGQELGRACSNWHRSPSSKVRDTTAWVLHWLTPITRPPDCHTPRGTVNRTAGLATGGRALGPAVLFSGNLSALDRSKSVRFDGSSRKDPLSFSR